MTGLGEQKPSRPHVLRHCRLVLESLSFRLTGGLS